MVELSKKYPLYRWKRNKRYGTKQHIEVIEKHGLTKHHRDLFVRGVVNDI